MEDRLRKLAQFYCNGNMAQFARTSNVHPSTLASSIARSVFGFDMINSILTAHPEISAEWLMRGRGEMINNNAEPVCPDGYEIVPRNTINQMQSLVDEANGKLEELKRDKDIMFEHIELLRRNIRNGEMGTAVS